jgi:predicted transcriptional regulator of viral defense system
MSQWTFLTNHALVLCFLAENHQITGREAANAVGITERAIRTIISDLHEAGYIDKERVGRRIRYHVNSHLPLRGLTRQDVAVGELLHALGRNGDPAIRRISNP